MKKSSKIAFIISGALLALFVLFTALLKFVDVSAIGPNSSEVGFATLNGEIFRLLGVNNIFDFVTDIFLYFAILVAIFVAGLGFFQVLKRESIKKVDSEITFLGLIYAGMIIAYFAFEFLEINFRPILLDEELSASYPSSHTLFVCVILLTAMLFANKKIARKSIVVAVDCVVVTICVACVIFRILSGMHWLTDVIGAILLSAFFVVLYYSLLKLKCKNKKIEVQENTEKNEEMKEIIEEVQEDDTREENSPEETEEIEEEK